MNIEQEIEQLKIRNAKVELDKKWETSNARKFSIVLVTYVSMLLTMFFLKTVNPFIDAIIPTLGFFLSTLSLSFVKKIWLKKDL